MCIDSKTYVLEMSVLSHYFLGLIFCFRNCVATEQRTHDDCASMNMTVFELR